MRRADIAYRAKSTVKLLETFEREKPSQTPQVLAVSAASLLLVSGSLELARRLFRNSQLFCPETGPLISWDPADYGLDPSRTEELWFDNEEGMRLHAWYMRATEPIASAVHCHGNTGNLTHSAETLKHFVDAGINVLAFDYRGFGRSEGKTSIRGVVRDAVAAAREHERIRPKHLPSILTGYSLGGAVAAQSVTQHPFDGLVLQSTFTNLPDITRVVFPKLPFHLLSGKVFDTLSVVEQLSIPLLIIHGEEDEAIPCWMARQLYEKCPAPKSIELFEHGLHKNLFELGSDRIVRALVALVDSINRRREVKESAGGGRLIAS